MSREQAQPPLRRSSVNGIVSASRAVNHLTGLYSHAIQFIPVLFGRVSARNQQEVPVSVGSRGKASLGHLCRQDSSQREGESPRQPLGYCWIEMVDSAGSLRLGMIPWLGHGVAGAWYIVFVRAKDNGVCCLLWD